MTATHAPAPAAPVPVDTRPAAGLLHVRPGSPLALWGNGLTHIARHYTWLPSDLRWGLWLAGGLGSFAVLQSQAFADYPDGDYRHTLSAFSRRWLGVYPRRPRRIAASIGLIGAFGVFAAHVLVGPPLSESYPDPAPRSR